MPMHADQLVITVGTASTLIAAQFPNWHDLPVTEVRSGGTVNALFRIGDTLTARFPLQVSDADAVARDLQQEADAAAELFGRTPFRTPQPVAIGDPGSGYPLPWSVQTWVDGDDAFTTDVARSTGFAGDLAVFISAVRSIDTAGRTFSGSGRGGDLTTHDAWVETCLDNSGDLFDVPRVARLWAELRDLPRGSEDAMTHGDLIPGNVLVAGGRLTGVIDVGGFGPADPALDLVAAWHLLDAEPREVFRNQLSCDELEWDRGIAWALEQALGAGWYYRETNPAMHRMALRTIERILAATSRVSSP